MFGSPFIQAIRNVHFGYVSDPNLSAGDGQPKVKKLRGKYKKKQPIIEEKVVQEIKPEPLSRVPLLPKPKRVQKPRDRKSETDRKDKITNQISEIMSDNNPDDKPLEELKKDMAEELDCEMKKIKIFKKNLKNVSKLSRSNGHGSTEEFEGEADEE